MSLLMLCNRRASVFEEVAWKHKQKNEADEIPRVAQAEGRQGSGCTASVRRGGADFRGRAVLIDRGGTHTLTVHIHMHQEARQRKGVVLRRRGPLSFCLRVRTTCSDREKKKHHWCVQASSEERIRQKEERRWFGGEDKGVNHGGGRGGGAVLLGQGAGGGSVWIRRWGAGSHQPST